MSVPERRWLEGFADAASDIARARRLYGDSAALSLLKGRVLYAIKNGESSRPWVRGFEEGLLVAVGCA